jgi:hypothetical protein
LPAPVGPRKMNEPIGQCGSCNPACARTAVGPHARLPAGQ